MMDLYYPNHAWLCLERDAFERLYDYKRRRGLPTWERTIEELLSVEDGLSSDRRGPPDVVAVQTEELTS